MAQQGDTSASRLSLRRPQHCPRSMGAPLVQPATLRERVGSGHRYCVSFTRPADDKGQDWTLAPISSLLTAAAAAAAGGQLASCYHTRSTALFSRSIPSRSQCLDLIQHGPVDCIHCANSQNQPTHETLSRSLSLSLSVSLSLSL